MTARTTALGHTAIGLTALALGACSAGGTDAVSAPLSAPVGAIAPDAVTTAPAPTPTPVQERQTLRAMADRTDRDIGIYVEYWRLLPGGNSYDPNYVSDIENVAGAEFDILTLGTYLVSTQWTKGVWNFSEMDEVAAIAERNGQKLRGHPLVYGQDNVIPPWLRTARDNEDWATVREAMREGIERTTAQYLGRIAYWDVVNEAVDWNGSKWTYRDTPYQRAFAVNGAPAYAYLDEAFHLARAGDPDAKLVYNDFSNLEINGKSDFIYGMVSDMLDRGVPIDVVGFQAHLGTDGRDTSWEDGLLDRDSVRANFQRFADLGLEIHITELDTHTRGTSPEEMALQAEMYTLVTELCLEQPACTTLQIWGFGDEYTWLDDFHGTGKTYPLLFDEDGEAKPAYHAVLNTLWGRPDR